MTRVWSGGRWQRADGDIDRGPMQVLPEDRWRRRAWRHLRTRSATVALGPAGVLFLFLLVRVGGMATCAIIALDVAALVFIWGWWLGALRIWQGRPLPGVYLNGIELAGDRYVPYEEVVGVHRRRRRIGICLSPGPVWEWLDYGIYGEEGFWHLTVMVQRRTGQLPAAEAPRLVVYGGQPGR